MVESGLSGIRFWKWYFTSRGLFLPLFPPGTRVLPFLFFLALPAWAPQKPSLALIVDHRSTQLPCHSCSMLRLVAMFSISPNARGPKQSSCRFEAGFIQP